MREVREIIGVLADRGKTIFLSSHLLWEVERTCTHVAIVRKGRIVKMGSVAEVVGGTSGDDKTVEVLVRAADDEALQPALEAYPEAASVRRAEDGGFVVGLRSHDLAGLNRWLADRGLYVSHLAPRRQSLEDAFMGLTEGGDFGSMKEIAS